VATDRFWKQYKIVQVFIWRSKTKARAKSVSIFGLMNHCVKINHGRGVIIVSAVTHDLYCSSYIIRLRWAAHVAHMGDECMQKPEGKRMGSSGIFL
jgi:hypothetical protein